MSIILAVIQTCVFFGQVINEVLRIQWLSQLVLEQCIETRISTSVAVHLVIQPLPNLIKFTGFHFAIKIWNVPSTIMGQLSSSLEKEVEFQKK
jgi:hypothetical protein